MSVRELTCRSQRCCAATALVVFASLAVSPLAQASGALGRVVLVGDSITVGPRDGGISYSDFLRVAVADTHEVVNLAVSGTSTRDWLPDQECTLYCQGEGGLFGQKVKPALPAEIVFMLLGTNDAMGLRLPGPSSAGTYAANLQKLSQALLDAGASQVVLMTPPPVAATAKHIFQTRLAGYAAKVRSLCIALERVVCGPDLFLLVDREADFAENDKLHLNRGAHTRIGAALAGVVRKLSPGRKRRNRRGGGPG